MAQIIPLVATPNQTEVFPTGNQSCQIIVYTLEPGGVPQMFIDVYLDNEPVILGVVCEDRNRIVRNSYLGFPGDLAFIDTQATFDVNGTTLGNDPEFAGLGARYQLLYLEAADIAAVGDQ